MIKVSDSIKSYAKYNGLQKIKMHLSNGCDVHLFTKPNQFDCFVVKNDEIVGAQGAFGSESFVNQQVPRILEKIGKLINL